MSQKQPKRSNRRQRPPCASSLALTTLFGILFSTLMDFYPQPYIQSQLAETFATLVGTQEKPVPEEASMPFPGPPNLPKLRKDRFPSVEQRIQIYMSNWYQPPCSSKTQIPYMIEYDTNDLNFPTLRYTGSIHDEVSIYDSIVKGDAQILLEEETISDCARPILEWETKGKRLRTEERIVARSRGILSPYCVDAKEIWDISIHLSDGTTTHNPLILQMGDFPSLSHSIPVIAKFRGRMSPEERQRVTAPSTCSNRSAARTMLAGQLGFAPIVWNLNSARHYGAQLQATKAFDVPWYEKKNSTLWRGAMTGFLEMRQDASDLEQCLSNTRCRFVYESRRRKSPLIDAGLSWIVPHYKGGTYCNGIEINANYTQFQEFLKYKVIISLEGNDVSSGLKWNLLSNSVVLMPPPTKTSWAMEELLEPWVHYVPIFANLSNVEDRIRWVLENDYFAKQIATRSTMFMEDLWFSDDAKRDDKAVKYGILKRYQKLWQ